MDAQARIAATVMLQSNLAGWIWLTVCVGRCDMHPAWPRSDVSETKQY